jgi:hypothetical protein
MMLVLLSVVAATYAETVKPTLIRVYVDIGGTLGYLQYTHHGPYYSYAISVRINSVSPSGKKVTVTINKDDSTIWSGVLGAGESSPTITVEDHKTDVYVTNYNTVTMTYTGVITLIYL